MKAQYTKQPAGRIVKPEQIIAIAKYMSEVGYLPTEPIAICKSADGLKAHVVKYGDAFKAMYTEDKPEKIVLTINGTKVEKTFDEVIAGLNGLKVDAGFVIADGRNRAMAAALVVVFGGTINPTYETIPTSDYDRVSLAGNIAKGLLVRLTGDGAVTQVIALHAAGKIKTESDCGNFGLKRGMQQRAFWSAKLVNDHHSPLASVLMLRGNTKAKKCYESITGETSPGQALKTALGGKTADDGKRALSRKILLEIIDDGAGKMESLLQAIADGNDISAKSIIAKLKA